MALQGDEYSSDRAFKGVISTAALGNNPWLPRYFYNFFGKNEVKWSSLEILCDSEVQGEGAVQEYANGWERGEECCFSFTDNRIEYIRLCGLGILSVS